MSTVNDMIEIKCSKESALKIIRKATMPFGSFIDDGNSFEIKDNIQRTNWSTTWPAKVTISIEHNTSNSTTLIFLKASNFGIGPIQSKECKSKLGAVKSAILITADEYLSVNTISSNSMNLADEIRRFKDLLDCKAITLEEFEAKKKELLSL